jgi:hypothetical protein
LEIVQRSEEQTFTVLPKPWIAARTFTRLSFHRRISKNYEGLPESGNVAIDSFRLQSHGNHKLILKIQRKLINHILPEHYIQ